MPNKNYVKGRRKEYAICNTLRAEGFDIVQRTAGSHSPVDVIAIRRRDKKIKLVQAKPDNFKSEKIEEELKWLNDEFIVKFEVI